MPKHSDSEREGEREGRKHGGTGSSDGTGGSGWPWHARCLDNQQINTHCRISHWARNPPRDPLMDCSLQIAVAGVEVVTSKRSITSILLSIDKLLRCGL
jgi:hypothetical protein